MEPSKSRSNEFERRASLRRSVGLSIHGEEEEDDFAAQALGIADGFRPQTTGTTEASEQSSSSSTLTNSTVTPASPPRTTNRSSIAKPTNHDSFSLRHDGATSPNHQPALSRVSSASTVTTYIHNERPYDGPSGPSHPYQMYPQNTRAARTLSVTTSSTAPVLETSYIGPRGPTHPYGLYPQGTVPDSTAAQQPSIPVGFPGIPDNYARRIGPEGEDVADMIGPDGHTEQLPPYTRYPDETYARKVRAMERPNASPVAAMQSIPGAGGLGLATRNPEFESADDLGSPRSRHSSRSFASDVSRHDINVAATGVSEKPQPSWKRRANRRAFGVIPYWALCLAICAVLIMGIVLGGVIGTFFGRHAKPHRPTPTPSSQPDATPTVTVTYDATPIPTPTDLPELPVGTFSLPIGLNRSPNTCFNDTTLSQAWSCGIIFGYAGMTITIQKNAPQLGKPPNYDIAIQTNQSLTLAGGMYSYGAQPPLIPQQMPMELVNDTYDFSRGPAWFRMLQYNKTVLLPETFIAATATTASSGATPTSGSSRIRRYGGFGGPGSFARKGLAQTGDKPWICVWPDTLLEVFIYPSQNTSYDLISSSTATSSPRPGVTQAPTNTLPYGAGAAATTASPTTSTDLPTSSSAVDPSWTPPPRPYPKVIKVEERRMNFAPQPTCSQVEVLPNGAYKPVRDSDGNPVQIIIAETEPAPPRRANVSPRDADAASIFARDGSDMSNCGCMWYLT